MLAILMNNLCFLRVITVDFSPSSMPHDSEICYLGTDLFIYIPLDREHIYVDPLLRHGCHGNQDMIYFENV